MKVKEMMEKLHIIIENKEEEELDNLLCVAVTYVLENQWDFLTEIIYDFYAEKPYEIRQGYLVIDYGEEKDGFREMKTILVNAILSKDLKMEEVSFWEKAEYLQKFLPLIPCMERKRR